MAAWDGLLTADEQQVFDAFRRPKSLGKRPAVLVEAHDDIIVLDLMQNPKFASNERVRGILGTLTPVVNVSGLSTEGDFLILQLRASPFGIPRALNAARALAAG